MKMFIGLFLTISLTSILAGPPALILTRLIKKNQTDQARKLTAVDPSLFLNRTSYSGFLTVDQKYNSNIFFWYFEAENHHPDTPWIMWLQGGPGATSLAGLFDEIGPFEYVDSKLKSRKWSWAKDHSLVFIDNPVGTGFSFTDSPHGFVQNMATCSSHLYSALRQFLMVFPELRKAPFYIAGESYAGRYIPALGIKIMEQDLNIGRLDINLQGIILGNPVLSRESVADYSIIYYQWGLIDSQGLLAVKPLQDAYNKALHNEESERAILLREELLTKLNDISMQQQTFNLLRDKITNLFEFTNFINKPNVRQALHVGSINFNHYNSTVHDKLAPDFLSEIISKIEMLLDRYKMLIYCGQIDLTAPCVPNAKARRRHWHWQYREQFLNASRKPWWFDNKVAGYVKSGGGLTEVLVRGAGHLVPMDKPAQTTELISYFIRGLDLKLPPNYQVLAQDTPPYINDEPEGIPKTIYQLPDPEGHSSSGTEVTMIISLILNVMLVCSIVCGIVYAMRWKRRTDAYMYSTMEDNNLVSTMF